MEDKEQQLQTLDNNDMPNKFYFMRNSFSSAAAFSLAAWLVTNITTVILNKYLFAQLDFHYPVTLTAIHMFVCCIGSLIAIHVFEITPWKRLSSQEILLQVTPLAILFFVNIVLGNVSLRWISVSFMQTVKASVPVFSVLIQVLLFGKRFDTEIYASLAPIVGGVMLATFTETGFNETGFYAAVIASVVTALLSIVTSILLAKTLDSINLLYYTAPISFLLLLPCAYFSEYDSLMTWYSTTDGSKIALLFASGIIAYMLNITTFLVIANTSALTYNIAGNFKVVFSIMLSVYIFQNKITILNGIGCAIAVVGVAYYNQIRQQRPKGGVHNA